MFYHVLRTALTPSHIPMVCRILTNNVTTDLPWVGRAWRAYGSLWGRPQIAVFLFGAVQNIILPPFFKIMVQFIFVLFSTSTLKFYQKYNFQHVIVLFWWKLKMNIYSFISIKPNNSTMKNGFLAVSKLK